jgi:hypothetical protein
VRDLCGEVRARCCIEMSNRSLSIEARERLRAQQETEAKAVAAHSVAVGRLAATTARRAEVIAAQDELIRQAMAHVAVAAAEVIEVSGLERASVILGVPKGSLRRQLAGSRHTERCVG